MLNGELYEPTGEELVQLRLNARLLIEKYNASSVDDLSTRNELVKQLFTTVGKSG